MTWNYRITRHVQKTKHGDVDVYALREVYYDMDDDGGMAWTDPIEFTGESQEDIVKDLRLALFDAENKPVLNLDTKEDE